MLRRVARLADKWAVHVDHSGGFLAEDKALLAGNRVFRDCHRDQRCFVIGNGPSLRRQDLSLLTNELTFVMSGFWKHPVVRQWQPTYYFFADPMFFDGSEPMRKFFSDLRSQIHSTKFFVPLSSKEIIQKISLLPLEKTYFVAVRGMLEGRVSYNGLSGRPDLARFVPGVFTVAQLALMAAIYMGCSPIYLLGLDHDWLAHRGMDRHFYNGKTIENHPKAHGDLNRLSYKTDAQGVVDIWNGYEYFSKVSKQEGIEIFNATDGGFLDVFERVCYRSLFLLP